MVKTGLYFLKWVFLFFSFFCPFVSSDLPQQHGCKEEKGLDDQERTQEDPALPQIKEEPEDLSSSLEVDRIVQKQDADAFIVTATYEESEPEPNVTNSFLITLLIHRDEIRKKARMWTQDQQEMQS